MGAVTIYDNAKKFKFMLLVCILLLYTAGAYSQALRSQTAGEYLNSVREYAVSIRENWVSDLYTTVGAMPLHPLPGHSGYLVPSVDDIVRLLAPVPYDTASKILICGPMAGYVGLVAGAAGFPVLIIEFGGRERGYVLEYTRANPDQLVQVASGRNLETFKEQGPFDVIIVTYGTQTMPAALLDQLSSESGIMILPLSDAFGSQLLTVIVKTESGFDLSVKGRTNLSFVNTAGQR